MHPRLKAALTATADTIERLLTGWILPAKNPTPDTSTGTEDDVEPPLTGEEPGLKIKATGTLTQVQPYKDKEFYLELTLDGGSMHGIPVEDENVPMLAGFPDLNEQQVEDAANTFDTWVTEGVKLNVIENKEGIVLLQNQADPEQWTLFPRQY